MPRIVIPLFLLCWPAFAGERLSLPQRHLKFADGVVLQGSERALDTAFPYLHVKQEAVTPATLTRYVRPILKAEQAIEAVRLFMEGPLVTDREAGDRIVAAALKLRPSIKHLKMDVVDRRPKSYTPKAVKVGMNWKVTLVAFEMDRILRLVDVEARVDVCGSVRIGRRAMVNGPMTSWQSMSVNGRGADNQKAMEDEARLARRRFARALAPPRDLDAAWAIARIQLTPEQISDLWGRAPRVVGSGRRIVEYDLVDGTSVRFDATDQRRPVRRIVLVKDKAVLPLSGPR